MNPVDLERIKVRFKQQRDIFQGNEKRLVDQFLSESNPVVVVLKSKRRSAFHLSGKRDFFFSIIPYSQLPVSAEQTMERIRQYSKDLLDIGIENLQTLVLLPDPAEQRLYWLTEHIGESLAEKIAQGKPTDVYEYWRKILGVCVRAAESQTGLDPGPDNFRVVGKKLVYVDLFPPLTRERRIQAVSVHKENRTEWQWIIKKFYKGRIIFHALKDICKMRPDLEEEIIKRTQEELIGARRPGLVNLLRRYPLKRFEERDRDVQSRLFRRKR